MKTAVYLLLWAVIGCSCSKFQYVTVDSDQAKDKRGGVFIENDSIAVYYKFAGTSGPASVRIYNKLDSPISVNWQQSTLLINEKDLPIWKDKTQTAKNAAATMHQWQPKVNVVSYENPTPKVRVSIVNPGTFIESSPIQLKNRFFRLDYRYVKSLDINESTVRAQYFSRETSPLEFRSTLVLTIGSDAGKKYVLDHLFWVQEISQTTVPPNHFDPYKAHDDKFYISKPSGFGVFAGASAIFAYILVITSSRL